MRWLKACESVQVNWQMLWAGKKKRTAIRLLGYLVLAFAVLFPVGIFTGEPWPPLPPLPPEGTFLGSNILTRHRHCSPLTESRARGSPSA